MENSLVVTRSMIWLTAGDYPYVDLGIKGNETFTNFFKSLTFYTPANKTAIRMDKTTKQAKEDDGMDLYVRPYSWWMVLDGISEISCSYSGTHGQPAVKWYNGRDGATQTTVVTEKEAKEICKAVKSMVVQAAKDSNSIHKKYEPTFGVFKKKSDGIFTPGGQLIKYKVHCLEYNHNGKATERNATTHTPTFKPTKGT